MTVLTSSAFGFSTTYAQTTFTWGGSTGNWSTTANWLENAVPTPSSTLQLTFGGTDPLSYTATQDITAAGTDFVLNSLILNSTSTALNTIAGSQLRFDGIAPQIVQNGTGAFLISNTISLRPGGLTLSGSAQGTGTITLSGALSGQLAITKTSVGFLDITNNTNTVYFGTLSIQSGALRMNGTTQTATSASFRNSPLTLGPNGSLLYAGSSNTSNTAAAYNGSSLRFGELNDFGGGLGVIDTTNGGSLSNTGLVITAFAPGTSSAKITTGANGVYLRGLSTQTLTGDTTAAAGAWAFGGAYLGSGNYSTTLTLSGASTRIVTGTVNFRGGSLVLDNSVNNVDRVGDLLTVDSDFSGGKLSLIGNTAGTTEIFGLLDTSGAAGNHVLSVTANTTAFPTIMRFDLASQTELRGTTQMTYNFIGLGGTLGGSINGPRIMFTTTPATSIGSLLSTSTSSTSVTVGWAVVNGTSWAGYSTSTGIIALTNVDRETDAAFDLAATNERTNLKNTSATLDVTKQLAAVRFEPNASGRSLGIAGNSSLQANGLMLVGPYSFSITGNGYIGAGTTTTRFFWVTDPGGTLTLDAGVRITDNAAPVGKVGDGWLVVANDGANNRLNFTANSNITLQQGVLRISLAAMGGGAASGGKFTTFNFRGGTLEIDGGGTLTRLIDSSGNVDRGAFYFDNIANSAGAGSPAFSAVNGNLTVRLLSAYTPAVTTPVPAPEVETLATLRWGDGLWAPEGFALIFGSARSDSTVTLVNNLALDSGSVSASAATYREIRVLGNGLMSTRAILSGQLTGSYATDILKTGPGILEFNNLTGSQSSYEGSLIIAEGAVLMSNTSGPSGSAAAVVVGNRSGSADAAIYANADTLTTTAPRYYIPAGGSGTSTVGGAPDFAGSATFGNIFDLQKNMTVTAGGASNPGSTITFSSTMSGIGGIIKRGIGTVVLSGSKTFTGGVAIFEGTLRGSASGSFGTAVGGGNTTITLNGGTLDLLSTAGITFTANVAVGDDAAIIASRTATGSTSPTLGSLSIASQTLSFGLGTNATSATINFATVTFTGNPTFDVAANTAVDLNDAEDPNGVTDGAAANTKITKTGAGRLVVRGNNSTTGGITGNNSNWVIKGGILESAGVLPLGGSTTDVEFDGGTWLVTAGTTPAGGRLFTFTGAGTIDVASGQLLTYSNPGQLTGSGAFTKAGLGTMSISAAQTTWLGTMLLSAGTLRISHASAFGDPTSSTAVTLAGGTLGLITNSISLPVNRPIAVAASTGSAIDVATGLTLTVPGGFSGVGPVSKTGDGKLVLSGGSAGAYTGAASVDAGTLAINQSINLSGGGSITVGASGTLQGTGTITGTPTDAVTINGAISPGNSIGTLTVSGASNVWNDGSSVYFEFKTPTGDKDLMAGTNWDYLNLTGSSLTLGTTVNLRIDAWKTDGTGHAVLASETTFDPSATYQWLFVKADSITNWTESTFVVDDDFPGFGVFGTPENAFSTAVRGNFWVSKEGNNFYINYSSVPEPGSLILVGVTLCGWAWRKRRRMRRTSDS